MTVTPGRLYAGMTAEDRAAERRARLLEAGLDVFGSDGPRSVRALIERSGLAPRYFYDEFANLDEIALALLDDLVTEAERLGLEALAAAPADQRGRIDAVLSAMVGFVLDDPRRGRVLLVESLGSTVLAPRRTAELRRFAGLLASYSGELEDSDLSDARVRIATLFVMGGFTETLTAALDPASGLEREDLIEELTELFLFAVRSLNRKPLTDNEEL